MTNSSYSVAFFDEEMLGRIDTKYLSYKKELSNLYDENIDYDTLGKYIMEVKNPVKFKDGVIYKFYDTSIKSVNEKGQFVNYQLITKQTAPSRAKQVAIKDTIIVANLKTNKGKACIVTKKEDGSIVSSGYLMIKPTNKMNIEYLQQILQCEFSLYYLRQIASTGLGMSNWSFSDLCKIKLKVPSLEEQERTLPLVKAKIKILEDKIKELEEEKKTYELQNKIDEVFSEVLKIEKPTEMLNRYASYGNYSIMSYSASCPLDTLDMISNHKFELLDTIQKKYNCKILKEYTSYLSGGSGYAKKIEEKTNYYRIMPKDMSSKNGILNISKLDNMSEENYNNMKETCIKKYDILMSVFGAGAIGRIVLNDSDINAVPVNNIVATIRANEEINYKFLFYYLYSFLGQQQIFKCITGTTGQISLSIPRVKKILVPILDKEKQQEIIDKIENYGSPFELDLEIERLQSIIDNDLNKYILNGYSNDLFELPQETNNKKEGTNNE